LARAEPKAPRPAPEAKGLSGGRRGAARDGPAVIRGRSCGGGRRAGASGWGVGATTRKRKGARHRRRTRRATRPGSLEVRAANPGQADGATTIGSRPWSEDVDRTARTNEQAHAVSRTTSLLRQSNKLVFKRPDLQIDHAPESITCCRARQFQAAFSLVNDSD